MSIASICSGVGHVKPRDLMKRRQGKNVRGSDTRDNKSVTQTKARRDTVGQLVLSEAFCEQLQVQKF